MTVAASLFRFEDSYAREVPGLSVPWMAALAPAPELRVLNEELAVELGVDPAALREPSGVALLVGRVPEGVTTVAQVYAGHQFGMYSPRLGDGRALLLGEVIDARGRRRDLHLKGSGRTRFARSADGKAVVGPMLREYLIGEAMHGLGIPTTRALAVVATGERVLRERALPGAVLTRVAASHLRVGTFQPPPRPATGTCCMRSPTTPSPVTTRRPPTARIATWTCTGAWLGRRRRWWPGGCWSGSSTGL